MLGHLCAHNSTHALLYASACQIQVQNKPQKRVFGTPHLGYGTMWLQSGGKRH